MVARWTTLCKDCAGGIDSLVELLQGRLSKGVMERICRQKTGLFPSPREVDEKDLIAKAGRDLPLARKGPADEKILKEKALSEIFGIEMAEASTPPKPRVAARRGRGPDSRSKRSPGRPTSRAARS